jgi:hypothetical protein
MTTTLATVVKIVEHSAKRGTRYFLVVCFSAECTYVDGPEEYMRADQLRTAHQNSHAGSRGEARA